MPSFAATRPGCSIPAADTSSGASETSRRDAILRDRVPADLSPAARLPGVRLKTAFVAPKENAARGRGPARVVVDSKRACSVVRCTMLALDQQALETRSLARSELLFRQGDTVTAIYFIETGCLRLERRTLDGRTLILGTTPANEFFVEAALFSDVFHCDAVAVEPSRV